MDETLIENWKGKQYNEIFNGSQLSDFRKDFKLEGSRLKQADAGSLQTVNDTIIDEFLSKDGPRKQAFLQLARDYARFGYGGKDCNVGEMGAKYRLSNVVWKIVLFITCLVFLGFLAFHYTEYRKAKKLRLSDYTNQYNQDEKKRKYSLNWKPGSAAIQAFKDVRSILNMDPQFWTFGNHGVAMWTNYKFPVDLINPLPDQFEPEISFKSAGAFACLSEITVRDEELKHSFVYDNTGHTDDHGDFVSVSADAFVPSERSGFVQLALVMAGDSGSCVTWDQARSRLTARCKSLPSAVILLSHCLRAIFEIQNSSSLTTLQSHMRASWISVSAIPVAEVAAFASNSSFTRNPLVSVNSPFIVKMSSSSPALTPSVKMLSDELVFIQNTTANFVARSVFVEGKLPAKEDF